MALLETSPAASVEQVQEAIEVQAQEPPLESKFGRIIYPQPAQNSIAQEAKTSPGSTSTSVQEWVDTEPPNREDYEFREEYDEDLKEWRTATNQEAPLESKFDRIVYPKQAAKPIAHEEARPQLDKSQSADVHNRGFHSTKSDRDSSGAKTEALGSQEGDRVLAVARDCETGRGQLLPDQSIKLVNQAQEPIEQVAKNSPGVKVELVQEPIMETVEACSGVDLVDDELPGCCNCFGDGYIEDEFGLVKFCQCKSEPRLSHQKTQRAIGLAAKNFPGSGSKVSTAHQLLELFKSSAHIIENSSGVKTEETASESEIAPATKNHLDEESDRNPILTGLALSANFLARYSPPQPKNIHYKADIDGQLSLLDFEIESVDEPPDPDDFDSLDAFREAIARWDWEHPSSSDHRSDLQSSVHCEPNSVYSEPPDPYDFDSIFAFWAAYDAWDEASDDNSEPLEISLDYLCEWAACPADWYEPIALDRSSKVLSISPTRKSSITSDFFIPTFGCLGDRSNRSDEPPDTGIFARLPKPKPPKFPPQSASQPQVDQTSRNYPETIPKLLHRVAAGSSTQPARSPPGGDA